MMHQMSPGVERAVSGARVWAERLESIDLRLSHFVLALLDEDEGRPAVLVERAGLSVPTIRERLAKLNDSQPAPPENELFNAARNWSLAYRHDPEFLTDAFLIVVLRANPEFERLLATFGLYSTHLEQLLIGTNPNHSDDESIDSDSSQAIFERTDHSDQLDAARVMDANFNRAREAARALEDYCRFIRNDRFLTEQLKELRHTLAQLYSQLPPNLLLSGRETLQDVGTSISASGEYVRSTTLHVAMANLKRLQESLRTLEEFGKLFAENVGRDFESLRYRTYTLEKALFGGSQNREKLTKAKLYALLSGERCLASLDWTIEQAASGGVDIVQMREKTLPDRELLARARDMRRWTNKAGLVFIVNDRPDIARLSDADGVHLGQEDISVMDARRLLGPKAVIGVSTHSIEQVQKAVMDGADYLGIGPVFPSNTKVFNQFPGLEFIRKACVETSLPSFALGGITPANIQQVIDAGAKRFAVGSAIAMAQDPEQVSRLLRSILDTR